MNRELEHGLIVTTGDATVVVAAKLMRQYDVGLLAVLDGTAPDMRKFSGLVTDRDLVTEVTALELDPGTITVGDLVQSGLTGHRAQGELRQTFHELNARGIRDVRVARNGEVTGVMQVAEVLIALGEA
ncbi:MAG: hypothetical protein ACM3RQ_00255 [Methanocella sp.]